MVSFLAISLSQANEQSLTQLARNYWENARRELAAGKDLNALHYYTLALQSVPVDQDLKEILQTDIPEYLFSVRLAYIVQQRANIEGAVFDQAEKRVLSWSGNTVRLWNAETGDSIGQPMQHKGEVSGAVFDQAGKRILSWSGNTVRLWDVPGDLDFPKDSYVIQVEALTGTRFDVNTRLLSIIPPEEWGKVQSQWQELGRKHANTCQYPRQNVYLRFWEKDR